MDFTVVIAFALTLFAGLATGIGSLIALMASRTNTKFLSLALGFSAGVMIYVSMIEIFVKAKDSLTGVYGSTGGYWVTLAGFFGGMIFMAALDRVLPQLGNPHEVKTVEDMTEGPTNAEYARLRKMGIFTALAIGIHNFPEGIATFISAIQDPALGLAIAIAVAIHNIPEGIAVSVPIYYATGDRKKAFKYSFLSGISEPIGAVAAWLFLMPYMSDTLFGIVFAGVAGIMIFISLDELLPAAKEYDEAHLSIYGLVGGMAVMAASLVLIA
ncbi:zinc transporter ZupT [Planococcus lenghuensis]|uniref:Zinc transporter ZupT n=1 Tax=Planococcus lenghuensis TaxID=2213202 RepID=A0A1Q2KV18_9BACL|nr:zinc transporter ZupT [Planococcus lenghuensis]AQQ52068.1 zinc transporter ZupT [Planococcus lenghuensis]